MTVDAIFADTQVKKMASTVLGYAETYSILLRKRNMGRLDTLNFNISVTALEDEILFAREFELFTIDNAAILSGIPLMKRHNINASDAAILAAYLRYSQAQPSGSPRCLLIASDPRVLRAASAEGLVTLNPETVSPEAVPEILAGL